VDEELERIFDYYVEDYKIQFFSYKMMGKLLETENIKKRIEIYNIKNLYVYGGGYLGVQLYNAVKDFISVKAIVDKSGGLSVDVQGIKSISFDELKENYTDEKIIITPVKYYKAIEKDLKQFIDKKNILFLGEFLEGVI
jgi:hypothetical protein